MPSWTCEPGRRERIDAFGKRLMSMERTGYEDVSRRTTCPSCRLSPPAADRMSTRSREQPRQDRRQTRRSPADRSRASSRSTTGPGASRRCSRGRARRAPGHRPHHATLGGSLARFRFPAETKLLHVSDVPLLPLLPRSRLKSACAMQLSRALLRYARLLTRPIRGCRRPHRPRPTRLTIRGME